MLLMVCYKGKCGKTQIQQNLKEKVVPNKSGSKMLTKIQKGKLFNCMKKGTLASFKGACA